MVYTDKRFEWDPEKARSNARKHGIPFFEAAMTFYDPLAKVEIDISHSTGTEVREKLIGKSVHDILCVIFTIRIFEGKIRIISARKANRKERAKYEKGIKVQKED